MNAPRIATAHTLFARWLLAGALALFLLAGLGHGQEAGDDGSDTGHGVRELPVDPRAGERDGPPQRGGRDRDVLVHGDYEVLFYDCQHRPANVLLQQLQALIGEIRYALPHGGSTTTVTAHADPRARTTRHEPHTLIVEETPARIRMIRELLTRLDVPNPQVLIESRIIEIQYSRGFQLGASFDVDRDPVAETLFQGFMLNYQPSAWLETLGSSNLTPFQGTTINFGNRDFPDETSANRFGLSDLTIRALQKTGRAEILANPRLLVQENEPASLMSGEEVYIQTVSSTAPGRYTFRNEAKSAGINLDVRPVLIGPDSVRMRLVAGVKEITGFTQASSSGIANPIISSRKIDTVHTVGNGVTLVIGGLILNESRVETRGIPILSDIPLLGELFRNHNSTRSRSEVIFIITPYIVYGGLGAPTDMSPVDDFDVFDDGFGG